MNVHLVLLALFVISCSSSTEGTGAISDISVADAAALIEQHPAVVILDIRTPVEYQQGHIAAAKNIDFRGPGFKEAVRQLDKDKIYLLHCASGGRSTRALPLFEESGFKQVFHLQKGMNGWRAAGQPVVDQ